MATMLIDGTKEQAARLAEANAIRAKTGSSATLTYDFDNSKGFADAIAEIHNDGTATADDILSGKTAYVGNNKLTGTIATKSSSDLTASGATVTVPSGYYATNATKSVSTTTHPNPTATINTSTGVVTASHTQTTGYVTGGTTTGTLSLSTQAAKTVVPSNIAVTAVDAGKYTTGAVTVAAITTGTAGTPSATKSISGNTATITPSVTNTTGYITGGTKTGTAVTVTASELVSGTKEITASTTTQSDIAVATYSYVKVNPTPSETKTATPSTTAVTVNPTSGKLLSSVTVAAITAGSATTPATTITTTPTLTISSSGLVTATNNASQSITPTVSAGYIIAGTAGTVTASGSATKQLTTQSAKTITPTESSQTAVASQVFTTGTVTVAAIPSNYGNATNMTAVASDLRSGKTAIGYSNGQAVTLTGTVIERDSDDVNLEVKDDLVSTLVFNSSPSLASGSSTFTFDFVCNGTSYSEISFTSSSISYFQSSGLGMAVYSGGVWLGSYRTVVCTGGFPTDFTTYISTNSCGTITSTGSFGAFITADSGMYDEDVSKAITTVKGSSLNTTASTATVTIATDSKYIIGNIAVSPTPSQTKTVTSSTTPQTVTPDSGKLLSSVTVNAMAISSLSTDIISGTAYEEATGDYAWKTTVSVPAGYHEAQTLEKTFSDVFPAPSTEGTATDLRLGKQLYNHEGKLLTGTMTEKTAATYIASTADQTISGNQYLTGAQTIKAVSLNVTASNMLSGTSAQIISNNSVITSVTGTMTNNGDTSGTFTGLTGSESYTIPAGYTTGGTVTLTSAIEDALADLIGSEIA